MACGRPKQTDQWRQTQAGATLVALITQELSLMGGFTSTAWSTYNPAGNPTTLDALGGGRVISTTNVAVRLAGFTVTRGYISSSISQHGGGALTLTDVSVYSNTN